MKAVEIKEGEKVHVIELSRIVFFQASGKNTLVRFIDKTSLLSSRMMKYYHDLLHEKGFFRVNRKYLINMEHILFYKGDDVRSAHHSKPVSCLLSKLSPN